METTRNHLKYDRRQADHTVVPRVGDNVEDEEQRGHHSHAKSADDRQEMTRRVK